MWQYNDPNALMHYGVKGMKWGVRRRQNEDGTLTTSGKKRYNAPGTSAKASSPKRSKPKSNARKTEEDLKRKRENIAKTDKVMYGSKIASAVLKNIGQQTYNRYANDANKAQVNIVRGSAYASDVLNAIGDMAWISSTAQRVDYNNRFWKQFE